MLNDVLKQAAAAVQGVDGVFLVAMDGMEVARSGDPGDFPLEFMAASYADIMRKLEAAGKEVDFESPAELMVTTSGRKLIFRAVTPEYGLLAVVAPGGITGKARYELGKAARLLRPELED
ncbi:MAG: roadblock/LC7 domain-containing protein [Acidobacteria bacterium]|uniref:Roadblock/LC7 domain-containing protein n=1 Tax=Candidatus Polarisedimenticola svalbardensis TaxID=2886004 RepID=A0A8J6YA30_9BACT|nr:roadblock/LC7 domain-containing protein [Candidatus Polarisedimenticola svalbardensis]